MFSLNANDLRRLLVSKMGEHPTFVLDAALYRLSRVRTQEKYKEALEELSELLDHVPKDMVHFVFEYVRCKIGYAVPTAETLSYFLSFFEGKKVLEVASGRGWFANLVRTLGKPEIYHATDINSFHGKVEEASHKMALEKYGDSADVLVLLWPNNDSMAGETLEKFRGKYVLYAGEAFGGCTADDHFHDRLDREWNLLYEEDSFRFPLGAFGLNDSFKLYERKPLDA